jgi:hypothetical protein
MMLGFAEQAYRDLKAMPTKGTGLSIHVRDVVKQLSNSIKFKLPEGGRILDKPFVDPEEVEEIVRLPYPCVALEYHAKADDDEDGRAKAHGMTEMVVVPERVLLARETLETIPSVEGGEITIPALRVLLVARAQGTRAFLPFPYGVVIPRLSIPRADHEANAQRTITTEMRDDPYFGELAKKRNRFLAGVLYWPFFATEEIKRKLKAAGLTNLQVQYDYADEVGALLDFCNALSCSNVYVADAPARSREQIRRQSQTRVPIFKYKVLAIETPRAVTGETGGDGTHRSPIMHLRRGHIRRLSNARKTWVNACVVGSGRGMLHKDYAMLPAHR